VVKSIHATRSLQPEVYVFHSTGALAAEFYRMRLPEMARALILRQFQNNAHESIQAISGALSDRWALRWGRRRPLIVIGTAFDFVFLAFFVSLSPCFPLTLSLVS
jgi:MFS family permease